MPASGGSLSDTNVSTNKVVNGQSHYLAYITPDEGKSLMNQGGKEVITDSGIPAYPTWDVGQGTTKESYEAGRTGDHRTVGRQDPMGGYADQTAQEMRVAAPDQFTGTGNTVSANDLHISIHGKHSDGTPADIEEQNAATANVQGATYNSKEDSLISQFKSGVIDKSTVIKNALKFGLKNSKKIADALGITNAFDLAMGVGGKVQSKAITWDLNRRLNKEFKKPTYDSEAAAYGIHEKSITDLQDKIERANLPSDHPDHYGQTEYMKDYPGVQPAPDDGGNSRGLTNIITPYAAHAIGGTTQQSSQAAKWYANLGSGNSNPGAFNLTQQYAAAKAAVSQKLQSTSSVGQIAVADSAFFNFLKDNSLNKGIL